MKLNKYSVSSPMKGVCKSFSIIGLEEGKSFPLVYLKRPKWIKDHKKWEELVRSIRLELPINFDLS